MIDPSSPKVEVDLHTVRTIDSARVPTAVQISHAHNFVSSILDVNFDLGFVWAIEGPMRPSLSGNLHGLELI